jgi:hypothetical protein
MVNNSTWPLDTRGGTGFNSVKFAVHAGFRNYGTRGDSYLLDGSALLDGTWTLGGEATGIFKGMASRRLGMGAYALPNAGGITLGLNYGAGAANKGQLNLVTLGIGGKFRIFGGLKTERVNMGAFKTQNSFNLSGTLERRSYTPLDGTMTLDGSWSLGEYSIKEDL